MSFKQEIYKNNLYLFIYILLITIISYLYLDKDIAIRFYHLEDSYLKSFFHFITKFGQSEWYLIPSFIIFFSFKKKNPTISKKSFYIFIINVVAGIGVIIIKFIFGRARPKLFFEEHIYGFNWIEINHKFMSFPSGHTITAMVTAFGFGYLFPKYRYLFVAVAILIAVSRVVESKHFVSDVIFSTYLGFMISKILYERFFEK